MPANIIRFLRFSAENRGNRRMMLAGIVHKEPKQFLYAEELNDVYLQIFTWNVITTLVFRDA